MYVCAYVYVYVGLDVMTITHTLRRSGLRLTGAVGRGETDDADDEPLPPLLVALLYAVWSAIIGMEVGHICAYNYPFKL